uniref:Assembly factor for spindle microtubules n=1 Tax=Sparus aurata TaxID=8175 RepID=A0A671VNX9_SPAAU
MSETIASTRRGFLDFSPVRRDDGNKENDVPTLSLIQFSKAPFLTFGTVKLGTSKSAVLLIENPTEDADAEVTVEKIPSSKGFSVDHGTFTIQPEGSFSLTVTWTPSEEGGIRELIVFNANGVLKHQAVMLGRAEAPKKKKVNILSLMQKLLQLQCDEMDLDSYPGDTSSSCGFSDSLESKSGNHGCGPQGDALKAFPDSPQEPESNEPRLTFFVSKTAVDSESEKATVRVKKTSFTSATVTKTKAPVEVKCLSGRKIKKSRRRLLDRTLELSDGSSQCESAPGTPILPVIDPDTPTKANSLCGDGHQAQEFIASSPAAPRVGGSPTPVTFPVTSPPPVASGRAQSLKSSGASSVKTAKIVAVAQSKLTFIKPVQTAIPRHPMPFAAKNMFYDERWIEKQERGFTWWLNHVLTPDDFKVNTEVAKVNAASIVLGSDDKFSVPKAPTKEEMSFSTYTARRKLNRLRRSACQLFTSDAMVKAIQRLELEVEAKRLLVRKDRHLWKDIGERRKVLNWLLSYNPLWLRIGLETIYGEMISLESNSDAVGLAMFILQRLLWNPDIAAEYRHAKVPHLYKDGHEEALSRFTLKKLLLLVCFLDKAKESRLIEHNPCLFCLDAEFKTSKDLLLAFSRDFLSGEGILSRHLGYLGLPVSHVQTPLDEFNFAVKNLAVDLKCGIRLVRVMELLIQEWSLSAKLRLPAISRLQKVHNVDITLQVLKSKGVDLKDERGSTIDSRDIVDGHREKTLSLLWKIIFAFQVLILDGDQLREEIGFLKKTLSTKRRLASLRADRGLQPSPAKTRVPYEHGSTKITLLMDWVRAVCDFYNLKVENFTVAFSDGRVLCYLIHHYHPGLLPEEAVSHGTTQTVECSPRGRLELNCSASDSDNSFDTLPTGLNGTLEFKVLLENEKNNFRLVNTAVSFLGGVPAMINPADMSNTIPNEKVVMSYLSFLCARLLDLRNETRAARVIQGAWRKYRLKKDLQLYKERNMAAVKIQLVVRSFLQRRRAKRQNQAAVIIQSIWRRYAARNRLRLKKEKTKRENSAAKVIQAVFRKWHEAKMADKTAAALRIQSWYRMQRCLHQYRKIKTSAVTFRGHAVRKRVEKTRCAAVTIQRRFRASLERDVERRMFLRTRCAAVTIQAAYRGKRAAQRRYLLLRKAAAVIQRKHRATILARKTKKDYDALRNAALIVQANWRGRADRKRIEKWHQCAALIQAYYRRHKAQAEYRLKKAAATVIQRHYRSYVIAKEKRAAYLHMRKACVTLQAGFRGTRVRTELKKKHRAATVIQSTVRMFLCRKSNSLEPSFIYFKLFPLHTIFLQALWRGHRSRRLNDDPKVLKLRHRLRKVSAEVREEDKLCNKTSSALDYLLRYKHFSYILEALKNLETATRLSPECCERLVESGATNVIFTLIRCCNRSVPCMDVITYSIQILLNLSKYHKTIDAVYLVENSVETLLDLLQRYREKAGDKVAEKGGSIFTKACFLLALLLQDKHRAVEVMKLPKVLDRIRSIYRLTARKHKMDAERTVIKQKMNASINGSFFVQATPRKTRPTFAPDWVLGKNKLKDIVDPLRAIQMVANTLSILL